MRDVLGLGPDHQLEEAGDFRRAADAIEGDALDRLQDGEGPRGVAAIDAVHVDGQVGMGRSGDMERSLGAFQARGCPVPDQNGRRSTVAQADSESGGVIHDTIRIADPAPAPSPAGISSTAGTKKPRKGSLRGFVFGFGPFV